MCCRYGTVSVRPAYVVALVLALAGLAAYFVVPAELGRRDRAALARAHRLARALPDVPGATSEGIRCTPEEIRCTRSERDPDTVAAELVTAFRTRGYRATSECGNGLLANSPNPLRDCRVGAETGRGHGVLVVVLSAWEYVNRAVVHKGSTMNVSVV